MRHSLPWIALTLFTFWARPCNAAEAARLEICPEHPRYLKAGDRHLALVGVSDRDALTIWQNDKGFSWREYLRILSEHRINYVRQDVFSWGALSAGKNYPAQFSRPAWPFQRTGPGKAVDGRPRFDLTRFNKDYFDERLKPFLSETRRLGIYVELTLFEGMRGTRAFADSLYAPANNINDLGLSPRFVTSDAALEHKALRAVQEAYVDRVLRETSGFDHVIHEIANESGGREWVAHFINYIHRHPTHPGRLVSAGEQTSSFDPRSGKNDIVVKHRGGGGPYATHDDLRNHYDALRRFQVGKPVLHNEYFLFVNRSTDDVNFPRKMMWVDLLAGGHSNFYDFSFWRGTGRTMDDGRLSKAPPGIILKGAQFLIEFLEQQDIPFWTMTPRNEIGRVRRNASGRENSQSHLFVMGNDAREFLCYLLGEGAIDMELNLPKGNYTARFYDPSTGRFVGSAANLPGGKKQSLTTPPIRHDIALHLQNLSVGPR